MYWQIAASKIEKKYLLLYLIHHTQFLELLYYKTYFCGTFVYSIPIHRKTINRIDKHKYMHK